MAKNNRKIIIWVAIISLIATLGTISAGGFVGWGKIQEQQVSQDTSIENVKEEGCLPARDNKAEIKVVVSNLKNIEEDIDEIALEQKEIREENKESFEKILKVMEKNDKKKTFIIF